MRWIRNKSTELQIWIDTDIPDIGEINVLPWDMFPCEDDRGVFLVNAYDDIFETVYSIGGWTWDITNASNVGTGAQVFRDKTWSILNFRSFLAGAWISVTQVGDEITITNTWASPIPNETLPITVNGQLDFTLTNAVTLPWSHTRVYVNWQKMTYGADYTFTSTTNLRWVNVSFVLATTDVMEIYHT